MVNFYLEKNILEKIGSIRNFRIYLIFHYFIIEATSFMCILLHASRTRYLELAIYYHSR